MDPLYVISFLAAISFSSCMVLPHSGIVDSDGWTSSIDGGGWRLVRHVPAGADWYRARDQLLGTEVYGTACGLTCDGEWSTRFDNAEFDQFLFATGDESKWLIADREVVTGGFYTTNEPRTIYKSSLNPMSYTAGWYRRQGHFEDPLISLNDHDIAIEQGNILYAENSYGGDYARYSLGGYTGANVFIRTRAVVQQHVVPVVEQQVVPVVQHVVPVIQQQIVPVVPVVQQQIVPVVQQHVVPIVPVVHQQIQHVVPVHHAGGIYDGSHLSYGSPYDGSHLSYGNSYLGSHSIYGDMLYKKK